jgi:hypothetical protein
MNQLSSPSIWRRLACCAAGVALSASAFAATSADEAQYRKELAVCESGKSNQDRATCLREAGAARDQKREGKLSDGASAANLKENALVRCRALPAKDRDDCVARVEGEGKTSGSVSAGGLYKETVTIQPGDAASAPKQ